MSAKMAVNGIRTHARTNQRRIWIEVVKILTQRMAVRYGTFRIWKLRTLE